MILFTVTNTFAAKLFATKLSTMSCLFSHSLLNFSANYTSYIYLFREMLRNLKILSGISHCNPIPVLIPVCEIAISGMEREWKKSIPTIGEREGNEKKPFPYFGNGNQRLSFWGKDGNGNSRSPLKHIAIKFYCDEGDHKARQKGLLRLHKQFKIEGYQLYPWLVLCVCFFCVTYGRNSIAWAEPDSDVIFLVFLRPIFQLISFMNQITHRAERPSIPQNTFLSEIKIRKHVNK